MNRKRSLLYIEVLRILTFIYKIYLVSGRYPIVTFPELEISNQEQGLFPNFENVAEKVKLK